MSRLYSSPYDQMFDPFRGGGYASLFGAARQPTARDILPKFSPEEEQGIVGQATDAALGGLSWVGDFLDKTFGGRALRGVLGGRPEEALSFIPGSDTLSLTDIKNRVGGRDLLEQTGLISQRQPNEGFGWNDVAGIGAELLLDPSMYFNPLGLTKVGTAAAKLGKGVPGGLERGWANQIGAGQRGLTFHVPLSGTLSGTEGIGGDILTGEPLLNAASWARSGATFPTRALDYGLNAMLGITPAADLGGAIGSRAGKIGRGLAPLFEKDLAGTTDALAQPVARDVSQYERHLGYESGKERAGLELATRQLMGPGPESATWQKTFEGIRAANPEADAATEYAKLFGAGPTAENFGNMTAAIQQKAELGISSQKLLTERAKEARDSAAAAISKYHRPSTDEEAIKNLKKWQAGKEELDADNKLIYDMAVTPADKQWIEGDAALGLPGGGAGMATIDDLLNPAFPAALPADLGTLQTLHAGRDLINKGYKVDPLADVPGLRFSPTEEMVRTQKQQLLDKVLSDEINGPGAVTRDLGEAGALDPNVATIRRSPGDKALGIEPRGLSASGVSPGLPFYKGLQEWADSSIPGFSHPVFEDPAFGSLAKQAVEDALGKEMLHAPMEVKAPVSQKHIEWADKNLTEYQRPLFDKLVDNQKTYLQSILDATKETGSNLKGLNSNFNEYFTRAIQKYPKNDPRASVENVTKEFFNQVKADTKFHNQREELFDGMIGGSKQFDEWAMNPKLSGRGRDAVEGAMTEAERQAYLREQLTGFKFPAESNPAWDQAKQLDQFLGTLPKEHAEKGVPFWTADIQTVLGARGRARDKVLSVAKTRDLMYRIARPIDELEKAGEKTKTVKDLVEAMKLQGVDEAGSISARKFAEQEGGRLGIPLMAEDELYKLKDLEGYGFSEKTFNDILKMDEAYKTPRALQPVVDAVDYMSNLFKTYVTRPFASFHIRNNIDNVFRMWRGDALDKDVIGSVYSYLRGSKEDVLAGERHLVSDAGGTNIRVKVPDGADPAAMAAKAQLPPGWTVEKTGNITSDEFFKMAVGGGLAHSAGSTSRADLLGKGGEIVKSGALRVPEETGQNLATDVLSRLKKEGQDVKASPSKLNPLKDSGQEFPLVKVMTEAGQYSEELTRLSHFATLLKKGWEPEAAIAETKRMHIDYGNLSDFEKGVMRRIFPWYSFSKGNLPPVLTDLAENSGKITGPMRVLTGARPKGEFIPSYLGEGAAVPIGTNEDGSKRYLSSFGSSLEDELIKGIGALGHGDVSRAAEIAAGSAMPFWKFPAEYLFNKQLFSGRPLDELKPYQWADLGGMLNEQQARQLTEVFAQSPASRGGSLASSMFDPRKSPLDLLINNSLGTHVTDVDYAKAYDAAERKLMSDQLQGTPGVRHYQSTYFPSDAIPNLTPEQAQAYAMYLSAEKRLKDAANERKKASGR